MNIFWHVVAAWLGFNLGILLLRIGTVYADVGLMLASVVLIVLFVGHFATQ
jgi:hypothetical protein